jgi:hypothetical protein
MESLFRYAKNYVGNVEFSHLENIELLPFQIIIVDRF